MFLPDGTPTTLLLGDLGAYELDTKMIEFTRSGIPLNFTNKERDSKRLMPLVGDAADLVHHIRVIAETNHLRLLSYAYSEGRRKWEFELASL